jgi:hypothetical protein
LDINTLKWAAARSPPKQYSERVRIDVTEDAPPLKVDPIETARRVAFMLYRANDQTLESTRPVANRDSPQAATACALRGLNRDASLR